MPVKEYRFAEPRKFRFDFCWADLWLAAEVDGGTWKQGRHVRGAGFERDCEKLNLAVLKGWRVLRFTTAMVNDGRALSCLELLLKGM